MSDGLSKLHFYTKHRSRHQQSQNLEQGGTIRGYHSYIQIATNFRGEYEKEEMEITTTTQCPH